jgi:hypothetical protein
MGKRVPREPIYGERFDVMVCPFCSGPSPVYLDRVGRPWSKCASCNARMFGSLVALKAGADAGHVHLNVQWPPREWEHAVG